MKTIFLNFPELDEALKAKSVPIIFNKDNLKAAELIKLADKA